MSDQLDPRQSRPVEKELNQSKLDDLKLKPQDEETASAVEAFVKDMQGKVDAEPDPDLEVEAKTQDINIEPHQDFDFPSQSQQLINEAIPDTTKIEITEEDRVLYLKQTVSRSPIRMDILLFGGAMRVSIRSRTSHEQMRVQDLLREAVKRGVIAEDDVTAIIGWTHFILAALMVERINGELMAEISLKPDDQDPDRVSKDWDIVYAVIKKNFIEAPIHWWNAVLSALQIFERKNAKLNSEVANQGFWTPRDSD